MKYFCLFISITLCLFLNAQNIPFSKLWTGISTKNKINKKLANSYYISYRNSFLNNYSIFGQTSLAYKLSKKSKLKLKYRYTWKNVEGISYKHRIALDFASKLKLFRKTKLTNRARFQNEIQNIRRNKSNPYSSIFRNKIIIDRKLSEKMNVFAGYEHFANIQELNITESYRFYLGTSLVLGKKKHLEIAYIHDQSISVDENFYPDNIISLKYNFSF
jgi:hypothetical protein